MQKLDQPWDDLRLNEQVNPFVTALVRDVGHRPADVVENVRVVRLDQHFRECGNSALDLIEVGVRLPLAQVAKGPHGVADK